MKRDLKKSSKKYERGVYLKYLNCSSKFIQPCNCGFKVHSYCMTVQVIQTRKIACPYCENHYNFSIKRSHGLLAAVLGVMAHYIVMLISIFTAACLFLLADGYLKHKHAVKFPE